MAFLAAHLISNTTTTSKSAGFSLPPFNATLLEKISVQANVTQSGLTGTVALQGSNDNVNFTTIGTATAIAANGTFVATVESVDFNFYQVHFAVSAGTITSVTTFVYGKGPA